MIPGFHHKVDKNCASLVHYTAGSGNFLPTFRDELLVRSSGFKNKKGVIGFLTPKDGSDKLSRNVGEKLPLPAV